MSYKRPRGRIPMLDFEWRVLAVVWMRPVGGGTSGGMVAHDLVNGCQATA